MGRPFSSGAHQREGLFDSSRYRPSESIPCSLDENVRRHLAPSRTNFEPSWIRMYPTTLTETEGPRRMRRTGKGWR